MDLSLSHLSMLIELTANEIANLQKIINDPSSADNEVNDSGELSMQYIALSSVLAEMYKNKWSKDSGHPSYKDLIDEIRGSV
jgi:hypothetical protein